MGKKLTLNGYMAGVMAVCFCITSNPAFAVSFFVLYIIAFIEKQ